MEQLCVCTGERWRVLIMAHEAVSAAWLKKFDADLPEPLEFQPETWAFESLRQFATDDDPLLDMHLLVRGHHARAWASFDGREARITNKAPLMLPEEINAFGDLVRVATLEETLEIAMRWLLAWGRLGCTIPTEIAFWFDRTAATAYVADNIEGWLGAGAPLPIPKKPAGQVGVFFGVEGADIRMSMQNDIADAVNEHHPEVDAAHVGTYVTERAGARVLLAVATR
jgi:hypothetical protein